MLGTCNSPNPASKKRLVSCCSCSAAGILFCWAEPGRGRVSKPVLGWGGAGGCKAGMSMAGLGWAGCWEGAGHPRGRRMTLEYRKTGLNSWCP